MATYTEHKDSCVIETANVNKTFTDPALVEKLKTDSKFREQQKDLVDQEEANYIPPEDTSPEAEIVKLKEQFTQLEQKVTEMESKLPEVK